MTRYTDEDVRSMHPRQQAVLLDVPVESRQAVVRRAHLIMNTRPGYIFSQALDVAARDLARVGPDGMDALDRKDGHAATVACARRGCAACAQSLNDKDRSER